MNDPFQDACSVQRRAAALGFDWPREDGLPAELWDKLAEEIDELRRAVHEGPGRTHDELGDLLFMVVNLARHLELDCATALAHANAKFNARLDYVLQHADELPPVGDPARLEAMDELWSDAKRRGL
jgi:uncharacterized protein YabN with tetrapyrrole methylase and pyrophosphatase domain